MLPPVLSTYRRLKLQLVLGSFVIILVAVGQAVGFFQQWEQTFVHYLPARFLPEAPRVVMITLEKSSHGFQAMDVAMTLRGLGKFHPRCIVINGVIEAERSSVSFLPDIISQLRKMPGLELIIPEIPSSLAQLKSVALIRYSPDSRVPDWPKVEGLATPGSGAGYLPESGGSELELPLFATTDQGVPIGSLWWWSLPASVRKSPPLLLFGHELLLSTHARIGLTASGSTTPSLPGVFLEMPLDDFLLKLERKEQGSISPTFDTLWDSNTIVIGSHDDATKVASLASLLWTSSLRYLPLPAQLVLGLGWIMMFIVARRASWVPRMIFSLCVLLAIIGSTLVLSRHGIILPFIPGVVAVLALLLDKR
jgi:hypothetical protein